MIRRILPPLTPPTLGQVIITFEISCSQRELRASVREQLPPYQYPSGA